jgi:diaminohydroxyphosphoribosylaminopyrimidine deaminase/5-amino-6-(5-phosphoribosylamino)uracil reductase
MRDPFPRVAGRGFHALRAAGIRVESGVLEKEARELNRAFITFVTEKRPFVTGKAAVSLDGKIATRTGDAGWITGPAARARGHALRAEADAIAVGIETVLKDDPALTAHGRGRNPLRVIFDRRLRTPASARLLREKGQTLILCGPGAEPGKKRRLEAIGASVEVCPADSRGVRVRAALKALASRGVTHLLVEGGGTLLASFLEAGLLDEVFWFVAPRLIGGRDAVTGMEGRGAARVADAWQIKDARVEQVGPDLLIHGRVTRGRG